MTAGRWPWKSVSAKECVTTHLPNQLALKMDGAVDVGLCSAIEVSCHAKRIEREKALDE